MNSYYTLLDAVRRFVRALIRRLAKALNLLSGGRLHPNTVTVIGLTGHIPVAWLIASRHNLWAALLLVVFGLFDTLDGELARLQKRAGSFGMLLDSVTDRVKEIILYTGVAWAFIASGHSYAAVWAVAALGCSILTSYLNAWGDAVISQHGTPQHTINQSLRGGVMSFEIRIAALVVGLLSDRLLVTTIVVAILSFATAAERFMRIAKRLP